MHVEQIEDILRKSIGKQVDLTIVHHVEGQRLRTTGKLVDVTEDVIKLEIEWRQHRWSLRKKKGVYVCNRKSTSLLSLFIED